MTVREEPRGRSHEPWNLTDLLNALEAAREVSPLPRAGWERTRQVLAFRLLQALAISYLDDGADPSHRFSPPQDDVTRHQSHCPAWSHQPTLLSLTTLQWLPSPKRQQL